MKLPPDPYAGISSDEKADGGISSTEELAGGLSLEKGSDDRLSDRSKSWRLLGFPAFGDCSDVRRDVGDPLALFVLGIRVSLFGRPRLPRLDRRHWS